MSAPRLWTAERLETMRYEVLPRSATVADAIDTARERWNHDFDTSGFTVRFKERYGQTPSAFLKPDDYAPPTLAKRYNMRRVMGGLQDWLDEMRPGVQGRRPPRPTKSGRSSIVVMLSDWHIGRDTTKILQRVGEIPDRVNDAVGGVNADECVVLFLGDMIDGEGIYPSQEIMLEQHVAEQVKLTARSAWNCLAELKKQFQDVRVAAVRGNHGRAGGSSEANWDNMLYQQLEILCLVDGGIGWQSQYGSYGIVDVRGTRGLVRHKAPVQGDTPAAMKRFYGWLLEHGADWIAYAHHHHHGWFDVAGRSCLRNGSLCGNNEYSESLGVSSVPSQLVFGIEPGKVAPSWIVPIVWQ